jgi:hypothetical protein
VLGAGNDPTRLDVSRFNEQVRAGSMLVAAGPWIEATVTLSMSTTRGVTAATSHA